MFSVPGFAAVTAAALALCFLVTGSTAAAPPLPPPPPDLLEILSGQLTTLIRNAEPMAVIINGHIDVPLPGKSHAVRRVPVTGSGFLMPNNIVVTTAEVAGKMERPTVTLLNGRPLRAEGMAVDEENNIAVLKVSGDMRETGLAMADSKTLEPGNLVITIGDQNGFSGIATFGMVSAVNQQARSLDSRHHFFHLVQFQGAVGPGASGSPLLNIKGEVVGMVMGISNPSDAFTSPPSSENNRHIPLIVGSSISFAIPSDLILPVVRTLLEHIHSLPTPGWMGLHLFVHYPEAAKVNVVFLGTAAYKAGIRPGDIVQTIGGQRIEHREDIRLAVEDLSAGQLLAITGIKAGKPVTWLLHIESRPPWDEIRNAKRITLPNDFDHDHH